MDRRAFVATTALLGASAAAWAQAGDYPNRPIRLILPFAPGGSSDVIARLVASKLSERLKQQVVVVNTPGAGGMIASQQAAAAAGDGYTLFYPNQSTLTIAPQLKRPPAPEPWTQFAPVATVLGFSLVLVAHPKVPANSWKELVDYARANPGKLSFASPGIGTTSHLIGELFKREAGISMVHVAYKGGAQAVTDVLGGQVDLFFEQPLTILEHVKAGKLKALGATSRQRLPLLPDVQTVTELGYPQLTLQSWSGLAAPIATPREVVALVAREAGAILDMPDVAEAIVSRGLEPLRNTPDEFARLIRDDYPRWGALIRSQNLSSE